MDPKERSKQEYSARMKPGDGNPYELYYNSPEDDAKRKFVLDICIPVKQL